MTGLARAQVHKGAAAPAHGLGATFQTKKKRHKIRARCIRMGEPPQGSSRRARSREERPLIRIKKAREGTPAAAGFTRLS